MFTKLFRQFHSEEDASGNLEYAVMIGAGILFIAFAFSSISSSVSSSLDNAGDRIGDAMQGRDDVVEGDKASYENGRHNRRPVR